MDPQETSAGPQISDLERERLRLAKEIQDTQARIAAPATTPAELADQQVARNRLDRLNDDYRALIIAMKPPQGRDPGTAPTTKEYPVPQADGSTKTYIYKWNGKEWEIDNSIPPVVTPPTAANRPPTDPSKWLPVRADPNDPNSRIVALQDPLNSSNRVTVTADASTQKPSVVDGERGQKFSWDGTTLKELIPASPEKRQIVQGQGGAIYSWDGQKLEAIQPGTYQAKNGDTMKDVVNGKYVTKTYQNGQWGTTDVLGSAEPGKEEGKTRDIVEGGYNVTQTVIGGDYVTTKVHGRATPEKPTQLQAPSDQPNIVTMGSDGQVVQATSPNFIPKTNAEIAARVGQIQQAMQAKRAEVTGKVNKTTYTEEHALQEYNKWYDQNVAPQQATLQAAQQDAAIKQAADLAKSKADSYQQALGAGTLNVNAFNALREANPIGNPGAYSSVMNQIGGKMGISGLGDAFTYQAENPMDTAQKSVNDALKFIDGSAAAATGMPQPNFQGMDLNKALGRDMYAAPGVPAPPGVGGPPPATLPGPGAGGTATAAPPGIDWAALQARQAQSVAEQQAQRGIGPVGPPPPTGPMAPNAYEELLKRQLASVAEQRAQAGVNPWEMAPAYSFGG